MQFVKECKKILFSFSFVFYVAVMIMFFYSQFISDNELWGPEYEPQQEWEDYGYTIREEPSVIMSGATWELTSEYEANLYTTYPIGFIKEVTLSEEKQQEIHSILEEISATDITFERFKELMAQTDKLLGGGSAYAADQLVQNFSNVPMTYEEALAEYNSLVEQDRITGGYARLFCDYMGIMLCVVPVFVAASLAGADKRAKINELVYSRKISSVKLILTRYCALIVMMFVPILLLGVWGTIQVAGMYEGLAVDWLALPKLSMIWLLPALLFVTAVGIFFTELVSSFWGIFLQVLVWLFSFFQTGGLVGDNGRFLLMLRHNTYMGREVFLQGYEKFIFNRVFYTVLALVLTGLTVLCYEAKRRGK